MKNLKLLDLQAALAGKAVMLRNGEKAYVRHHETGLDVGDCSLLGYTASGDTLSWRADGRSDPTYREPGYDIIGMYLGTRNINGFEVPAPETSPLIQGTYFYIASPTADQLYVKDIWSGQHMDRVRLERGLVFLSKEDAIVTAGAMLGIDPHNEG